MYNSENTNFHKVIGEKDIILCDHTMKEKEGTLTNCNNNGK